MKNRIEYLIKNNYIIQRIYIVFFSLALHILSFFIKTNDKLILFSSFGGKSFNDSPKVIYDSMIKDSFFNDYEFIWAFTPDAMSKFSLKKGQIVKIDSFKYFIIALKSKIWITSVNIERGLAFKKRKTIYVNTWHGAGTKKIGNAVRNRNDYDLSNVDFFLTQSEFESCIFINDFNVKSSSLLKIGQPRCDVLYNYRKFDLKSLKQKLNIPVNKKVILYAPTWRDSTNSGKSYDFSIKISVNKWREVFEKDYVLLFRSHTFTTNITKNLFNDFFIDVSNYNEMNELLLITDILITDYSTSIYDYSILKRPFFIYGYDYTMYLKDRGFYIDYLRDVPFPLTTSENELIKQINNYIDYPDNEKFVKFSYSHNEYGGNATNKLLLKLKERLRG